MGKDATMKEIPKNVSESTKRRNPHLYQPPMSKGIGMYELAMEHRKRIRQSTKPILNKLEQEYFERLQLTFPKSKIHAQSMRFKLGNGIWYKPDLAAFACGTLMCWEVKGPHAFRGGFENLKVAASLYTDIEWTLVWKDNGEWQSQKVLP